MLNFPLFNYSIGDDSTLEKSQDSDPSPSTTSESPDSKGSPDSTESTASSEPKKDNPEKNSPDSEEPPPIEARTFNLKVIKRSASNKVYLFEDLNESVPPAGRILLLKKEGESFMAFRVLKSYTANKRIAAKRIKRYNGHRLLERDDSFLAIEKLSDLSLAPSPSSQDKSDLKEIESSLKVKDYDPELDAAASPQQSSDDKADNKADDKDDVISQRERDEVNSHLAVSIDETQVIEQQKYWLTAGFGYVRNNGPNGSYYFSAGNLRFATNLNKMVFLDHPHLQDSVSLEGGAYLYKALNFTSQGDAYTIVSWVADLRYNLFFNESFAIFFYAGAMVGYVVSSSQTQAAATNSLNSFSPAIGGGILFQVGPNWYTRIDMGYDAIGLNLVLRF